MKKEVAMYIIIGVLSVATDYGSYLFLANILPTEYAKTISYVCGMVVGFLCNRTFTFKSNNKVHHDALRFTVLYMGSLLLNVLTNELLLYIFPSFVTIAFLVATSLSVIANYVGQKFWVYTKR